MGANNNPDDQLGTHTAHGRQARTNPRTGREEIRDGKWWVDAEALAPYGYDPDSAPPELVEANRIGIADSARQEARQQRGGGGFQGNGAWAQIMQAAGMGDLVQGGWTRNNPQAFSMAQELGYGHSQLGVNGTIFTQGIDGWTVRDKQGNVIQEGQGTAPPGLIDTAAQTAFEQAAGDAIRSKGGALAQRLQGNDPSLSPAPPKYGVQRQEPQDTSAATKVVNGVTYRQQPDGTWIKVDTPPTPPTPAPAVEPPQTPPAGGGTQRPPIPVQPRLTGMQQIRPPQMGPTNWWKGPPSPDGGPQMEIKPFKPLQIPGTGGTKPPTPGGSFGGIKLR